MLTSGVGRKKGKRMLQANTAGERQASKPGLGAGAGLDQRQTPRARPRVDAVDLLRGLMVALMVLDHVREYFSADALLFEPNDMLRTTPALFLVRWVTHLCAPSFVLLSGLSVHIQATNGRTDLALARRLLARGGWLILLELTVIGFGFNFSEPFVLLQVIWAIGLGMIVLAAFIAAPRLLIGCVGAALVAFDLRLAGALGPVLPGWLFHALLLPGPLGPVPGMVAYPALPWVGIFLLGYAVGPWLLAQRSDLARRALMAAAVLIPLFVALRVLGIGDPLPWGIGASPALRALSFINVSKYPPSPQYVTLMLGTSALLLAGLHRIEPARLPMLRAFGRAPFFTYLVHIYLVHGSALLLGVAIGTPAGAFAGFIESAAGLKAAHWGLPLGAVLLVWAATLVILRPLAIRFAAVKNRRTEWWLSYL